ncbi:unnamed protein product [Pipistrellus nathusii]|uniref:Uncharacterized protein n=1 Tax=Pipistrellus nathusii TaxID=59473 RepID=A0ABP0AKV3_PIPNA
MYSAPPTLCSIRCIRHGRSNVICHSHNNPMRQRSQLQNSETASEGIGPFPQGPTVKRRAFRKHVSINLCLVIPLCLKQIMRNLFSEANTFSSRTFTFCIFVFKTTCKN